MTTYTVTTAPADPTQRPLVVGRVVFCRAPGGSGWRFLPACQLAPSRRLWATPEAAVAGRLRAGTYRLVESRRG